MNEIPDMETPTSVDDNESAKAKITFYQSMKRHPLVTGGLVLAGAGLAYAAVRTAKNSAPSEETATPPQGVHVETSIAIDCTPEELYGIWRDVKMLPLIMTNLESVTDLGNGRSHWVLKVTNGIRIKWDAETIKDKPSKLIAWRSVGDADVNNAGSVRFQPGPEGRGTFVRVSLNYDPPAGKLGDGVAHLLGYDPEALIKRDLQQFKQMMETGEIATIDGQPSGRMAESAIEAEPKLSTMGHPSDPPAEIKDAGRARPAGSIR
jgi:uncharacterized membrane protein